MTSRKYTGDYRLENTLDIKGRSVTVAVYKGRYFGYADSAKAADAVKAVFALLIAVACCELYVLSFSRCFKEAAVIIPLAGILLPLYLCAASLIRAYTALGKEVTREHCDKSAPRLRGGAVWITALSLISAVSAVVYQCISGTDASRQAFTAVTLAMVPLGISLILLSKRLAMAVTKEAEHR